MIQKCPVCYKVVGRTLGRGVSDVHCELHTLEFHLEHGQLRPGEYDELMRLREENDERERTQPSGTDTSGITGIGSMP